jgi:hypothetical protein
MPKNTVTHQEMAFAHLKISRGQILDRLWELANLSHEVSRGVIAGQIKALTMIVAIEGLIPVAATKTQPAQPHPANETSSPNLDRNQPPVNPFINPGSPNWVPDAIGHVFDAVLDKASSIRLPFSPEIRYERRR